LSYIVIFVVVKVLFLFFNFFIVLHLFICVYIIWATSPLYYVEVH
jgi:hypothetical protein